MIQMMVTLSGRPKRLEPLLANEMGAFQTFMSFCVIELSKDKKFLRAELIFYRS